MISKEELLERAAEGRFLWDKDGYKCFADMDGKEARRFLESFGFEVVKNYDTGYNGLAITACGIRLSTNGYICTRKE